MGNIMVTWPTMRLRVPESEVLPPFALLKTLYILFFSPDLQEVKLSLG